MLPVTTHSTLRFKYDSENLRCGLLLRRCREDQRLDDHRHRAGRLNERADIDEVEVAERDAVDGDDRAVQLQLFLAVQADDAADVAVVD